MTTAIDTRRHDIDALRVIAFGLLILYHVGMVFVHDWGFHIKSPHQWTWLQWPMVGVNRWRMELIFLLSGLALGLSRSADRPGRLIGRRSRMLLVPLVFGMLAVVPIQAWVEASANGAFDAGFGAFLLRYWQLRPWPAGEFAGAEFGITWNHLWYLAYLWAYTMALVPLLALARRLRTPIAAVHSAPPRTLAGGLLLLAPVGWLLFALNVLEPRYGDTKTLVDDWAQHAMYFPVFLFGFWLARRPAAWRRVVELRRVSLSVALSGLTLYMGLRVAGRVLDP
ncbi:MAG TPA: acyltransferase family protein, partial [Wenzhouxiangellaceae bacterium]|nr:acyltransferase family protein [Wenzhouxiangellaceae bacterium]